MGKADLLGQVPKPAAHLGTLGRHGGIEALHAEFSLGGRQGRGQQPQQRRLAGAVRPEQPDHAGTELQADVGQGPGRAELTADPAQADGCGHDQFLLGRSSRKWRARTKKMAIEAMARTT